MAKRDAPGLTSMMCSASRDPAERRPGRDIIFDELRASGKDLPLALMGATFAGVGFFGSPFHCLGVGLVPRRPWPRRAHVGASGPDASAPQAMA